jgi:anti-anti-sigma regulatory factor
MRSAPRITINASGSLVTFEYCGQVTAENVRAHAGEVEALVSRVQNHFTILVDLTDLEQMDPQCAPILSRMMEQLSKMGVARVVRVIPDPKKDIGLGILSLFHYRSGIKISTVRTRAEASQLVPADPRGRGPIL